MSGRNTNGGTMLPVRISGMAIVPWDTGDDQSTAIAVAVRSGVPYVPAATDEDALRLTATARITAQAEVQAVSSDGSTLSSENTYTGTSGNDTLTGTTGNDTFDISQGGNDTVYTMGSYDDIVNVGAALTAGDKIIGAGIDPNNTSLNIVTVVLDGDYSAGLTFAASTLQNVSNLSLTSGHSYRLTLNDAMMFGHYVYASDITIYGNSLQTTDTLYLDGSAETDASIAILGGAGSDTLIGGAAGDNISGNAGNDVIYGNAGDDVLSGGAGNDIIFGGAGDDEVDGGYGVNTLYGEDGNDTLNANLSAAGTVVYGGNGDDTIYSGLPNGNTYDGGSGYDIVNVAYLLDTWSHDPFVIDLTAGTITDGSGTDTLVSIEGVLGTYADDVITGDAGDNWLSGGARGNDVIEGGLGNDTLVAATSQTYPETYQTLTYANSPGAEFIDAGHGVAWGGEDFDTFTGFDIIVGSAYNDVIIGSSISLESYHFIGGDGNDTLMVGDPWWIPFSTPVGSTLEGGNGDDTLIGSFGDDLLIGGSGTDTMTGGAGMDVFRFDTLSDIAADHITDFAIYDDKVDFSAVSGLSFIGAAAFSGVAGQMRYRFSNGATIIEIDADGDGTADHSVTLDDGEFALAETASGSCVLTVADTTAPTLVSIEHVDLWDADWQQPPYPTAVFRLTFDEDVIFGTGKIDLYTADGTLVGTSNAGGVVDGNIITISSFARLTASTEYYVVVEAGAFTDIYGNPVSATTPDTAYHFTTAASHTTVTPHIVSVTPSTVAVDGAITITFDNPFLLGSGYIYLSAGAVFGYGGGRAGSVTDTIYAIDINDSSQVTVSGNTLTIKPANILPGNLSVAVQITYGAILNSDGLGQTYDTYAIQTASASDTVAPQLVSAVFGDGSANAPQDGALVLTFSEDVREGIWGSAGGYADYALNVADKIFIFLSDGTLFATYDSNDPSELVISGNTVTITPSLGLPANTDFYVVVGPFAIEDYSGNFFGGAIYANAASSNPIQVLTFHTGSTAKGTASDDVLLGTSSADAMYGLDGNDVLTGNAGNDTLNGGAGMDMAVFSGNRSAYTITRGVNGSFVVVGPDGTDTLTSIERLQFADQTIAVLTASADANGDGTSDIFWQNDSGQAAIWTMNGLVQIDGSPVGGDPGSDWHVVGIGDFNGDGYADILWQNDNGQADIWTMNGFTQLDGSYVGGNPGSSWHIMGTGDFNGDGKSDILWQNDSGQAAIWTMNGLTQLDGAEVGINPGSDWHVICAADFDGDGKSDILWQNDNGQAAIWLMDGFEVFEGSYVGGNPGTSWHVVGAADFNGDGKADILWQNDNGQAAIWTMDGLTQIDGSPVGGNPGSSWHVIGAGDYNGDGAADILWQNDNGQAAIWTMNGLTQLDGSTVGGNPGTSWHVVT